MKNRVVLIKGSDLAKEITVGQFERLDVDYLVLAIALKFPHLLPTDLSPDTIFDKWIDARDVCSRITEYLQESQEEHHLLSDYVRVLEEYGWDSVRVVEGDCLNVLWLYTTIRSMHKCKDQSVVEVSVTKPKEVLSINGLIYGWQEGLEVLGQHRASLG